MKDVNAPKNNPTTQGSPIADRSHHDVKADKKMNGISNGGGQRSDQTSNKDNTRKHENKA
ncbi:hypothetical protein WG904_15990 [Pedobacter sp. Du54]|uniref:hypothetical protein n=1 Tax=Pedobacter anseongensis TaxID=3133439 RepID=UPI0030AE226A